MKTSYVMKEYDTIDTCISFNFYITFRTNKIYGFAHC